MNRTFQSGQSKMGTRSSFLKDQPPKQNMVTTGRLLQRDAAQAQSNSVLSEGLPDVVHRAGDAGAQKRLKNFLQQRWEHQRRSYFDVRVDPRSTQNFGMLSKLGKINYLTRGGQKREEYGSVTSNKVPTLK